MKIMKKITETLAFRICLIGILGFGLSIPLSIISSFTTERQSYSNQAINEVISKWGDTPELYGPFISYESATEKHLLEAEGYTLDHIHLPEKLNITGELEEIKLKRGLFKIPVYKSKLNFSGNFSGLDKIKNDQRIALWNKAKIVFLVADPKSLKKEITLSLANGQHKIPLQPGKPYHNYPSIEAPLAGIVTQVRKETEKQDVTQKKGRNKRKLSKWQLEKIHEKKLQEEKQKHKLIRNNLDFQFELFLHGSKELFFMPAGETTKIKLGSNWPHPKFTGDFLPTSRKVSKDGFNADWNIPLFSRGQSENFHNNAMQRKAIKAGVSFFEPTNIYVLNDRSLKYALISIAVVFLSVFIVELYSRKRVHWVQYMFVGFALVVFYFLLLGISEHFGFKRAYLAASTATGLLIGGYIASVTGHVLRGVFVMLILYLIYAMLYMLLNATDYAMLAGSVSIFIILAITMFATRNVDWSNAGSVRNSET